MWVSGVSLHLEVGLGKPVPGTMCWSRHGLGQADDLPGNQAPCPPRALSAEDPGKLTVDRTFDLA
jgi:hypothetical protein